MVNGVKLWSDFHEVSIVQVLAGLCRVLGCRSGSQDRLADFLTDWNTQELTQIQSTFMDPLYASRDLAILQVVMYDAINGVNRQDNSFYVNLDAPAGTSLGATMAAAGLQVMSTLYGSNSAFTSLYNSQIASLGDSQTAIDQGITWGTSVANMITSYRATDGASNSNPTYTASGAQGDWAPTPPAYSSQPLRPGWATSTPSRSTPVRSSSNGRRVSMRRPTWPTSTR